jgi:hypothetical protein
MGVMPGVAPSGRLLGVTADEPTSASGDTVPPSGVSASPNGSPASPRRGERRWLVRTIIGVATVLAVLGIFAIWANRQMLNPDNWANTSTKLLENAAVREATSNYLVEQLYANVDVAGELKARLPPQLQPLAGPVAGALRNLATEAAQRALANARVQAIWKSANRAADQTFVTIVNGGTGAVNVNGGEVTLNLSSVVADVTNRLGLPNVSSKLPPSIARLRILRSKQIKAVQDGGKALKGLALALTIIVPLLYALAILLARERRRQTLMAVGVAIVFAGVIVFAARAIVESQVVNSLVKVEANRPAAEAVLSIATEMLGEIAGAFVIVGVPLMAAAWFAGPARLAVRGRRLIAPFLRDQPAWTFGIVLIVMILIFIWGPIPATHRPAGIIVFLALALFGTEVLRRQTARELADTPQPGHAEPAPAA